MKYVLLRFSDVQVARSIHSWIEQVDETNSNVFFIQEESGAAIAFPLSSIELTDKEVKPYLKRFKKFMVALMPMDKKRTNLTISIGAYPLLDCFVEATTMSGLVSLRDYWLRDRLTNRPPTPTSKTNQTGGKL